MQKATKKVAEAKTKYRVPKGKLKACRYGAGSGYCREFQLSVARCAHYDFRKNFLELRPEVYRRNTVCKHRLKENLRYMSPPRNKPPARPE